jgi:hypothetical protein
VGELALEKGCLSKESLDELLEPAKMLRLRRA